MKEERYFYLPCPQDGQLPPDEARHATRVLRLGAGDAIWLTDGQGHFHQAEITTATNHHCLYRLVESHIVKPQWQGHIHLAMAPTKMMERVEWLAEKATEIGLDRLTFLHCQHSERRQLKADRLERIVVAAMKQSHKAWKPQVDDVTPFEAFVRQPHQGQRFICHCHDMRDVRPDVRPDAQPAPLPHLLHALAQQQPATVMIGPEGDFSIAEVRLALECGFQSVSLGQSRLRTETAALVAVHCMQLRNQILPQ